MVSYMVPIVNGGIMVKKALVSVIKRASWEVGQYHNNEILFTENELLEWCL